MESHVNIEPRLDNHALLPEVASLPERYLAECTPIDQTQRDG